MSRILLVHADTDDRDMYEEYLGAHGYDVAVVSTTDAAQSLLPSVDLLITGLLVGGTRSPVDLIETAKLGARGRTLPVIVVTASILVELHRAASTAGADEILLKPCFPEDLLNAVERMLESHGMSRDTPASSRHSLSSDSAGDTSNHQSS
jgi:two-component system cell cycle response regulator DivK